MVCRVSWAGRGVQIVFDSSSCSHILRRLPSSFCNNGELIDTTVTPNLMYNQGVGLYTME